MYPQPGDMFPTWKSTFLKRVTFPSGKQYLVGCGIYNMQMDKSFIEDVVNRASDLVEKEGESAFQQLRDKRGPFVFMDTYVFVTRGDGKELVNPGQPSLEGKNLIAVKDAKGQPLVRDYIAAAEKEGSAWIDYYWYKSGQNEPAKKHTYVRKVQSEGNTYIMGFTPNEESCTCFALEPYGANLRLRIFLWCSIFEDPNDIVHNISGRRIVPSYLVAASRLVLLLVFVGLDYTLEASAIAE